MGPMGGGMLVDVGLADVRGWWAGRSTSADWRLEPDWLGPCGKSPPHTRLPTDQPGWWTVQLPQCQAGAEPRLPGPRPCRSDRGACALARRLEQTRRHLPVLASLTKLRSCRYWVNAFVLDTAQTAQVGRDEWGSPMALNSSLLGSDSRLDP